MTAKEFEMILIEGLNQTPESLTSYFKSIAKQNDIHLAILTKGLLDAFERLYEYVNSNDYESYCLDETGKREYIKKTINLNVLTSGKIAGTLTNKNILYLWPALKSLVSEIKKLDKTKESKQLIYGFNSRLTDEQIQTLFEQLKGEYLDSNINPNHFKAVFKIDPLPSDFIPIKRVKKFTNTLLAYFISELFQSENQSDYWHIAGNCFEKAKNLKQSLKNAYDFNLDRKPKGYKEIDKILKSIYSPLQ